MAGTASAPGAAIRRPLPALLVALVAYLLSFPGPSLAHQQLLRSTPADGARLSVVPGELRLVFNEAVELAVARIELTGPGGVVEFAPLRLAPDSAQVLIAEIRGGVAAGTYTVAWQVMSADGHPVRGIVSFVIESGAQGLAQEPERPTGAEPAPPPMEHHPATSFPTGSGFDAESPLYAGVRWLTFLGLLGVIGAVAFRLLVLPLMRQKRESSGLALIRPASDRTARFGLAMSGLVGVAALLRLYAQSYALHGSQDVLDPARAGTLLAGTVWGWGWLLQAAGVILALIGFALARKDSRAGWTLATAGAVALAFTPGLSGHAAATPGITLLAVLADGLHVLGAGGWLGSLLLVVIVGIPLALRPGSSERGAAVASLVHAFSPTALFFAGMVVATGVFAAWLHLGSVSALWQSTYGRILLLKVGVLLGVFGTGVYNFLRVKPALGDEHGARRLRRSAAVELAVGAVVLAITAVLVATAPPKDMQGAQETAQSAVAATEGKR